MQFLLIFTVLLEYTNFLLKGTIIGMNWLHIMESIFIVFILGVQKDRIHKAKFGSSFNNKG